MPGYLVVGLGNPGPRYQATRHNAGSLLVDRLALRWGIALEHASPVAVWGAGQIAAAPAVLAKPVTFMNTSGQAAAELQRVFAPDTTVVAFDDLDLPLGRVRIRGGGGGDGGHRGVASVIEAIGPAFVRVRIGIGRPSAGCEALDFVLGLFTPEERIEVDSALGRAEEGIEGLIRDGLDAAMRLCNGPLPLAIEPPVR